MAMRVAIMQPYVFPYLGYYQLLHAADRFVLFDDVNFIKKGWINRNRILLNGQPYTFTIPVQDVSQKYDGHLTGIDLQTQREDRLCELNVIEQVVNVCQTTVVESAWERGQEFTVHGWIYRLNDGRIRDLRMSVSSTADITTVRDAAVERLMTQPLS